MTGAQARRRLIEARDRLAAMHAEAETELDGINGYRDGYARAMEDAAALVRVLAEGAEPPRPA